MVKPNHQVLKRGVVINIDNTVSSIQEAIKEAGLRSNVDIRTVNVGIAGQHIKSMQHRGHIDPDVTVIQKSFRMNLNSSRQTCINWQ